MSNKVITGLREEFREVSESGHVYCYFGDETVTPIDATDHIPAGATYRLESGACVIDAGVTAWREMLPC